MSASIDISAVQSILYKTGHPVPASVQEAMAGAWLSSIPAHLRKRDDQPPKPKPKPVRTGISDAQRAEIIRLRKAGLTYQQIREETGVGLNTIGEVAKGLPAPANRRIARLRKRRDALLPEILRLRAQGLSSRQIAPRVGIDATTINRYIREARK